MTGSWIPKGIRDYRVINTPGYTRLLGREYRAEHRFTGSWIPRGIQGEIPGMAKGIQNITQLKPRKRENNEHEEWNASTLACVQTSHAIHCGHLQSGLSKFCRITSKLDNLKVSRKKKSLPPSTLCISESAVVGVGGGGLVVGAPTRTKNPMSCCTIHWFANGHAQVIVFPAKFWPKKNFWCLLKQSIQC